MGWDALTISRELRRNSLPGVNTSPPRRQEFGHWEGDLLQFRTQRGNLLTLIERVTRLTLAAPLKTKTAEATDRLLRPRAVGIVWWRRSRTASVL